MCLSATAEPIGYSASTASRCSLDVYARQSPALGSLDSRMNLSVAAMLQASAHHPVLAGGAIIIGTFILEDAATVLAAMQVQTGGIPWDVAVVSLYVGIVLGDMGLYGLGALASGSSGVQSLAARLVPSPRQAHGKRWLSERVFRVVFISRFIPGARLPTYTACGWLRVSFRRFVLAAVVATSIWTTLLFVLSLRVGRLLTEHLGAWRWAGAVGFAAVVVIAGRLIAGIQEPGRETGS